MTEPAGEAASAQRIDRWLCIARFLKTRTAATAFVEGGRVRLARPSSAPERVTKASQLVRIGDVLTFSLGRDVRVVRVTGLALRRGPASVARLLYDDLSPPTAKAEPQLDRTVSARRDPGAGRPTKRDRRRTERLRGSEGP